MRYTCPRCGRGVKDKFIFGTLHVCLTDEELAYRDQLLRAQQRSMEEAKTRDTLKPV